MSQHFDVIVVGLGAAGSATLYQLALRGKRVLGIDKYSPPHTLGSSHGETRITRQAIGEGEEYVPLAIRSHEIWRSIEKESGSRLFFECGGLMLGDTGSAAVHHGKTGFLACTIAAAEKFGIRHEILDTKELRARYPQFGVSDGEIGYFEPGAGYLRPESCIRAQLVLARRHGAEILTDCAVTALEETSGGVSVRTMNGEFRAEQAVVSVGPWLNGLLGWRTDFFKVHRQTLFWFEPRGSLEPFLPDRFPIFIWSFSHESGDGIYGFPAVDGPGGGIKVASEQYAGMTSPETVDRAVSQDECSAMHERYLKDRMPLLSGRCVKSAACLYTSTPDGRFVIQRHPQSPSIIIVSPCSGHGFKHSPAVGEAVASLVAKDEPGCDLSKFRIGE